MAAGDASTNPAALSALSELIKVHYGKALPELIENGSPLLKLLQKKRGFTQKNGGRQFEFPYETARGENVKMGTLGSFLPGFSGNTNDDIDSPNAETAVVNRARIYATASFDGLWLSAPNRKHFFDAAHQYARILRYTAEDLKQELEWQILGDQTGLVGLVQSVGAFAGGVTPITLEAASSHNIRGIAGTQRVRPNMKLRHIEAADWATSATASQANSTPDVYKVSSYSAPYDVGSSPIVNLAGDQTSNLAAGDALVRFGSRTETAGGSSSGATLFNMLGILNFIDDGTIGDSLYGLSRTSFPVLSSPTDLSLVGRTPTWKLLQSKMSQIERIIDPSRKRQMTIMSELGVQDNYVPNDAEAGKRYIQEDKALKAVSGFDDVVVAFLGGNRPIPWVRLRDFPYGHLVICTLDDFRAMWDAPPGTMNEDGLTLRQVQGKDEYYTVIKAYGQIIKELPMFDTRFSGLTSSF